MENTMTSITMPTTTACTDPALLQLVADYIALHDTPTAEGISRLFTPSFTVHGPSHADGVDAQGYLAFLQSLQGLCFRQAPGAEPTVDEEGRLILPFVVTREDKTLAAGVDTIWLQDGKISRIVGVY
jgi:hypothetical protein